MLPTIGRIPHPLVPADAPDSASAGHSGTDALTAISQRAPGPCPGPSDPGACSPIAPSSDSPKTKNRSDSGQKWTDSTYQSSQPPPLNPQPLWSFQPDEPAADYQLFAAWLQLPAPRGFTKTAATLGCSPHRLRRLSARHNWKTRAAAFDNHRANAASLALDQLLRDETSTWKERTQRFRLQEWLLHEQMLQAATDAAREIQKRPSLASLNDIVKLFDLASALGRRACGMPLAAPPAAKFEPPFSCPDLEAALDKIYGPGNCCKPPASPAESPQAVSSRETVSPFQDE